MFLVAQLNLAISHISYDPDSLVFKADNPFNIAHFTLASNIGESELQEAFGKIKMTLFSTFNSFSSNIT